MSSRTFGFSTAGALFIAEAEAEGQIRYAAITAAEGLNRDIKRSGAGEGTPVASGALQANTNVSVGAPDFTTRASSANYLYPRKIGSSRPRNLPARQFSAPSPSTWMRALAGFRLGQSIFIANATMGDGGHPVAQDIEDNATGNIDTAPSWQAPAGFFYRTISAGLRRAAATMPRRTI